MTPTALEVVGRTVVARRLQPRTVCGIYLFDTARNDILILFVSVLIDVIQISSQSTQTLKVDQVFQLEAEWPIGK